MEGKVRCGSCWEDEEGGVGMSWRRGHGPDPQGLSSSCDEFVNEEQSVEGCDRAAG